MTQTMERTSTSKPKHYEGMIHREHPDKPGEAWCGSPVQGIRTTKRGNCVVCEDLVLAYFGETK